MELSEPCNSRILVAILETQLYPVLKGNSNLKLYLRMENFFKHNLISQKLNHSEPKHNTLAFEFRDMLSRPRAVAYCSRPPGPLTTGS